MRWMGVLACVLMLSGCGPTPIEIGSTALLGAAVYLVVSGFLLHVVAKAWHRIRGIETPALHSILPREGALGALHIAVTVWAVMGGKMVDAWPTGIAIVGASHMSLSLVLWRIFKMRTIPTATLATALCLLPAVLMIVTNDKDIMDITIMSWLVSGYMGVVPAVICVALFIEALIRRSQKKKHTSDPIARTFD